MTTLLEGVKSTDPIIHAIAVKVLWYQDLMHVSQNPETRKKAKYQYDALVALWDEIQLISEAA